jgi:hypothetical protein
MYEWLSRTALELVGQGGMGYSFDSLQDGEVCEYTRVVKDLMYVHSSFPSSHHHHPPDRPTNQPTDPLHSPTVSRLHIPLLLLPLFRKYLPLSLTRLLLRWAPLESVRTVARITQFLDRTSRDVLERKRAELREVDESVREEEGEGETGRDVLSVLRGWAFTVIPILDS